MSDAKKGEPARKKIGELLVESGYVTTEQVREALEVQERKRERIASILINLGYLSESDFLEFLGTMPGAASIDLSACGIEQEIIDLVPTQLARSLEIVPIVRLRKSLTIAMVCPLDEGARKKLEEATGLKVRPVLCSRGAVYKALDIYYAESPEPAPPRGGGEDFSDLTDKMKLRRVAKLVEEIGEIPTLPAIIRTISEIVNDPDSSTADLAKVISSDVGLSSKILKFANSAAFGFSREISDIQHAITLLGFQQTQTLALSVPVFENLIKLADFDFKSFWSHSLRCAQLSRLLSLSLSNREIGSAFVAGLFHDIGQVVLAMSMRGKQEEADALQSETDMNPIEAEEKVLGITHAEIGFLLGEHWLLPSALTAAMRYHHSPELQPQPQDIVGIVFLANAFCEMGALQYGFDERTREVLDSLEMSEAVFREAFKSYVNMEQFPDIEFF